MQHCKSIDTPIGEGEGEGEGLSWRMCPKTSQEEEYMRKTPYTSVVGSLMYTMMYIRPNICFVVSMVSRYQFDPSLTHWKAIKWILRYLKGIVNHSWCYKGNNMQLKYCTSSYLTIMPYHRTIRNIMHNLVHMEAKFEAFSIAIQEALWLKWVLYHLGVNANIVNPILVNYDS